MDSPIKLVTSLKRNNNKGVGAPHKPVLLLAIIRGYETGVLSGNLIQISPELLGIFKQIWNFLVRSDYQLGMGYPFFYLKSEPFWELTFKQGAGDASSNQNKAKNISALDGVVDYAKIEAKMASWLNDSEKRKLLTEAILQKYFPLTKASFYDDYETVDLLHGIDNLLLNTPKLVYRSKIEKLMKAKDFEAVYLRSTSFKRTISMIYDFQCAASQWKAITAQNISMIDACHIVPFSVSHDDTVQNGIALAPTLHRAFDRGLISISDSYQVLVDKDFQEEGEDWSLRRLEGKQILLPRNENHWPSKENLLWHRSQFGFQ